MAKVKGKKTIDAPDDKEKALELAVISLEKEFGKGVVIQGSVTSFPEIGRIPSGSISLDKALSGGYAKGRMVEVLGPESCIYRDSFISYEVWDQHNRTRINHKGGTIGKLYKLFHNKTPDHLECRKAIKFYVKSVNDEGSIIRNEVLDVVKTGEKECIQIATQNGNSLVATPEHKFLTPEGYKPLENIQIEDTIFIHNNTRRKGRKQSPNRPDIMVKYHPHWPTKVVHDKKTGNDYLYYRGQKSRAVYESFMNNMTFENYRKALNEWSIDKIKSLHFLPTGIHVHHLDENFTNNEITNLILVDPSEHGKLHAKDRHANLSFTMVPDKIVMKETVGFRETYDIKCATPYNNYIAEGIVVHNSGKTTLALHAVAECQKDGGKAAFIDVENALDVYYADSLDVDVEKLLISQPDSGESALNVAEKLTRSGAIDLIVIDSVAALVPRKEIEGEIGDSSVGQQARMMSQAMRMLVGPIKRTNTTVIFINQIRSKIGVMFGSSETTCVSPDTMVEIEIIDK